MSLLEKIIFYLSYENALRTVDILNLKISDLDFERKELTIIQAKTKNSLKLGISDRLLNYIELYLKDERPECDAEYLLIGHGYNRKLKRLDRTTINKCVEAIIINSGVKIGKRHRGPHSLRASRATQLMNMGVPLPVISSYLGHTSTESTKNYLKADIDHLRECALDPIPVLSPGLCALLGVMKNDF